MCAVVLAGPYVLRCPDRRMPRWPRMAISPTDAPRRGWAGTVLRTRLDLNGLPRDSPSLRQAVADLVRELTPPVARLVAHDLGNLGEMTPDLERRLLATAFTPDQVIGDWLPDAPA